MHPQPRVQSDRKHTSIVTTVHRNTRPSLRNGFNGLFRALPGDRALLPPSPALLIADLTPASGRQDHTTSPSASAPFVCSAIRVHRIPPRGRDDRVSPLCGTGRRGYRLICVFGKSEYFCKRGWTRGSPNSPSGKSVEQENLLSQPALRCLRSSAAKGQDLCGTDGWHTSYLITSVEVEAFELRLVNVRQRSACILQPFPSPCPKGADRSHWPIINTRRMN